MLGKISSAQRWGRQKRLDGGLSYLHRINTGLPSKDQEEIGFKVFKTNYISFFVFVF